MKLIEIYVAGFGKISGMRLSLSDGLNILKRENGFGKTTLAVFIKAMLYGLDKTKKQSVKENDRRHYMPWNGGRCGGSLTFQTSDKIYRIERTFMSRPQDDTFKLYDERTGKDSFDFSERIGEELFGVDEDGFLRTVFLSEENLSGKSENKTVAAKLTSLVGCDGDISSLDKALLSLEDERKIYYKRGGGGEIAMIQSEISKLDGRIAELMRLKDELRENEEGLRDATCALRGAELERKSERQRAERESKERVRRAFIKQYKEMKATLDEDEKRLGELDLFFGESIPTAVEIENMRAKLSEAALLERRTESEDENSYVFGAGVSESEYERAAAVSEKLTRLEEQIRTLSEKKRADSEMNALPTDELLQARDCLKSKKTILPAIFISVLLFAVSVGLGILVEPLFFLGSIVALIPLAVGILQTAKAKKQLEHSKKYAKDVIKRVTGRDVSEKEALSVLDTLCTEAERGSTNDEEIRKLGEIIEAYRREACIYEDEAERFIRKFDEVSGERTVEKLNDILLKKKAWQLVSGEREARIRERMMTGEQAKVMRKEVQSFLSRFNTQTDRPLDEIAARLIEREALLRSLTRTRQSVSDFKEQHGITDEDLYESFEIERSDVPLVSEIESDVSKYETRRALYIKRCDEIATELACLDGLTAERDALLIKRAEAEKRLFNVTRARDLLLKASDSLTSKYLSKTKEAFSKYIKKLNAQLSGRFTMDTSFSIMRNEGGEYKDAEAYSLGTRDLYSLALRLALVESLYEGERPFLILDDPFAHLDDQTLPKAKALIKSIAKEKQILYLTCADSRAI